MKRTLVLPLAFALLVPFARSASAQITQRSTPNQPSRGNLATEPHVSTTTGPDYNVTFDPDALEAALEDGTIPRIVVRPVKGLGLLTRPRTHFVPELLKSVEAI
jgi:hypothetical protein